MSSARSGASFRLRRRSPIAQLVEASSFVGKSRVEEPNKSPTALIHLYGSFKLPHQDPPEIKI